MGLTMIKTTLKWNILQKKKVEMGFLELRIKHKHVCSKLFNDSEYSCGILNLS
jgi:hypothetical protein